MISHKFREVMQYADTVTVLRKGKYVGSVATCDVTTENLSDMMLGGDKVKAPPARQTLAEQPVRLQVNNLSVKDDQLLDAIKKISALVFAAVKFSVLPVCQVMGKTISGGFSWPAA